MASLVVAVLCCGGTCVAEDSRVITIENGVPQLFVDDWLIESQTNL
jgi:hypothetical protein